MAWNEPGGNGKDPWGGGGNRGGGDGPPDLDEAMRKLQEKLSGIFGGGGGGAATGQGPSINPAMIGVVFLGIVLIWAAMGFYQVDQQERAVILRLGKFLEINEPGLHWNSPLIDHVEIINTTKVRSHSHQSQMLTEDENIVDVSLSVQYSVNDPKDFYVEVRDPERSLAQATESALRHVVGSAKMHAVLTEGRSQLAADVQQRLQGLLDSYESGILVTEVNVEATAPPTQVQAAFDDVQKAIEDEQRAKNEAEAYSNGIIPESRGRAQRQIEEANAYREQVIARAEGEAARFKKLLVEYNKAPQVTRERLYLDAVQETLGNLSKVMVDVDGGNNMIYLPLDRMMQPSTAMPPPDISASSPNLRELTDRVVEQLRRDSQAARRREVR